MVENQNINVDAKVKKAWSKPKLYFGKGIGFLGLGHVQTTGPTYSPS